VLKVVRNVIVEFGNIVVEAIVLSKAILVDPSCSIVIEELSIKIVSNSTSILYLSDHVSDSLP
jgi:hypothetical protein